MIDQIAAAFQRQDYRTAAQLIEQLLQASPHNPWAQFYLGQLHEVSGRLEAAETVYRNVLRATSNTQVLTQARQGLQRLQEIAQQQRQNAIAQATADPDNTQTGVLILEPVGSEIRTTAAQKFAQIMQLDPYTARLQLPTRGWRFYRSGKIGELRFFGEQLRHAGIPCFWATLVDIEKIRVFQVRYFDSVDGRPTVVCQNEQGQLGSLRFSWSQVTQRVSGLLPIFEQVVDRDARGKLQRKTQTADYVQFCDFHLPGKYCILRLHDRGYQFAKSVAVGAEHHQDRSQTNRLSWNNLMNFISQQTPQATTWGDFTLFAETVIEQTELLRHVRSHIHLFRRTETNWDPAFHLYSGLIFLKNVA